MVHQLHTYILHGKPATYVRTSCMVHQLHTYILHGTPATYVHLAWYTSYIRTSCMVHQLHTYILHGTPATYVHLAWYTSYIRTSCMVHQLHMYILHCTLDIITLQLCIRPYLHTDVYTYLREGGGGKAQQGSINSEERLPLKFYHEV